MSTDWRAVGEFVILRMAQSEVGGLIISEDYAVESVGDMVNTTLKVNDRVALKLEADLVSLTPSNSLTQFYCVHYSDIMARGTIQHNYIEE